MNNYINLCFFASTNNAAVSICVHFPLGRHTNISRNPFLEMECQGQRVLHILTFRKHHKLPFKIMASVYTSNHIVLEEHL